MEKGTKMGRVIDADELIKEFEWLESVVYEKNRVQDAIQRIKNAPTVDAVEVVRCKNCKHWTYDNYHKHHYCANKFGLRYVCPENNFCSYGERRSDEDTKIH